MITAIVYTTNTGFTAKYAKLLGESLSVPVYASDEAKKSLASGSQIIYLGWLMASQVKGYKKVAKFYQIAAVCGVGMGAGGSQMEDVRKNNAIPAEIPLFTLQGGFEMGRLRGIYKFMMNTMKGTLGKKLMEKPARSPEDEEMRDLLLNGGTRVSLGNLRPVLDWYAR